jgi:TonB-dependent SusC/RagA subfamily outer membrane receptor
MFFIIMSSMGYRSMGQDTAHPSEARILALLDQYFGAMPSSSPGLEGRRTFRVAGDTLFIESRDPRDLLTGAPFQTEHRIPLRGLGAVRTQQGKGADGRAGLALEFIPLSNLQKLRPARENGLSAESRVEGDKGVRSSDIGQRMAGRASGVTVANDNSPGGSSRMRVRGPASFTASGTPLYLVDGVPISNLNAVNPEDIVSMEVLKDASATALYAVRGANGVVVITTRKGDGKGDIPAELAREDELTFILWTFGERARRMRRSGDDRRLADLLEYRAGLAARR